MGNILEDEARLASPALVKKLRDAIPTDITKSWMKHLDDKQLVMVYLRLQHGETNSEVIGYCQKEFKIKPKAKVSELLPEIVKFRTAALNDTNLIKIEAAAGNKSAKAVEKKIEQLSAELDGMGRLGWLIDLQTKRVIRLHDREEKTLPMTMTTENIKLLGGMLKEYIEKQIDLGIVSSTTPKIKLDIDANFKSIVEAMNDDGERMISATHRFLELAEKKALVMRVDDDGSYTIDKEKEKDEEIRAERAKI